jgi:hypothetical protein
MPNHPPVLRDSPEPESVLIVRKEAPPPLWYQMTLGVNGEGRP